MSAARKCEHGLRWGNMLVLCDGEHEHEQQHGGLYLHSRIVWRESDRRDFVGEDPGPCPVIEGVAPCVLPKRHHGDHAF